MIHIEKAIIHRAYAIHKGFPIYDIAVAKLATPLTFNRKVKPIRLASQLPHGESQGYLSGWGRLCDSCGLSDDLQDLKITVLTKTGVNFSLCFNSVLINY